MLTRSVISRSPVTIFEQDDPTRVVQQRSRRAGWLMLGLTALIAVGLSLLPAPYVIDHPGPTFDTLGSVETSGGDVSLISISGAPTYEPSGELRLTTVTRSGNPENLPGWLDVVTGWLDPSRTVIPVDVAYPPGVSVEANLEAAQIEMRNSQQESVAAALGYVGVPYTSLLVVAQAMEGGPSEGVLESDDVVVQAAGQSVTDVSQLREIIADSGAGKPLELLVERAGRLETIEVVPRLSEGDTRVPMIGIVVSGRYEFPIEVDIALENVGGPSAGLIFALGIVEMLSDEDLTSGTVIAGTGTITAGGDVGSIGGIRHKMLGALNDGASVFLAPASNCPDIVGHIPEGLVVVPVATLSEAVDALRLFAAGEPTATCPVRSG
jgi:PDZ domain-containing protein